MNKKTYIKAVLREMHTNKRNKQRIKEDLSMRIDDMLEHDLYCNIEEEMGKPEDLAIELMQGFDENYEATFVSAGWKPFEYKSKVTLFGLPLVHIKTGGRYGTSVAKGVIAIGDVAMGVVSVGGVSIGLLSLGGVSIGLLSLGGVALGGLTLGGVAIGLYALGGVSIGILQALGVITV
jgi:hypothetical protein